MSCTFSQYTTSFSPGPCGACPTPSPARSKNWSRFPSTKPLPSWRDFCERSDLPNTLNCAGVRSNASALPRSNEEVPGFVKSCAGHGLRDVKQATSMRDNMKLRKNEYCPIHHSRWCCGREQRQKEHHLRLGVQRIEDPHHPRGYGELRSSSEMRKLMNRKISEQGGKCAVCREEFFNYSDIVPDHGNPKGMGGAWRDDHPENVQAVHRLFRPRSVTELAGDSCAHPPSLERLLRALSTLGIFAITPEVGSAIRH